MQLKRYSNPARTAKILLFLTIIACWIYLLFYPMHTKVVPTHKFFNISYLIGWTIMVIAMMGGYLFSTYTYIGNNTLPQNQIIGITLFTVIWLLIWIGIGEIFSFIPSLEKTHNHFFAIGSILIAAGLWNITKWKQKALSECHKERSIYLTGLPFYKSTVLFGTAQGWSCVKTCWLMMLAMKLAPMHILSMIIFTVIGAIERITLHPRKTTHTTAAILIIIGVSMLVGTIL